MDDMQWQQLAFLVGEISRTVFSDLKSYETMVEKWQSRINLVANSTLGELWHRHILDSAQLWPLAKCSQRGAISWVDFGSGGGFPGLVMAIFMKEVARGHVILVESNGKKAAFLRQVVAELHLPATILNRRIEECYHMIPVADIITARALAPLPHLFTLIFPYFAPYTTALLPKGRASIQEMEQAREFWDFTSRQHASLVDPQSAILEVTVLYERQT